VPELPLVPDPINFPYFCVRVALGRPLVFFAERALLGFVPVSSPLRYPGFFPTFSTTQDFSGGSFFPCLFLGLCCNVMVFLFQKGGILWAAFP